jgi:hypothetical protein
VAELPRYWDALTERIPKIKRAIQGQDYLINLDSWLRRTPGEDDKLEGQEYLPNLVLTPLVVLAQLTQYWRYLELNQQLHGDGANSDLQTDLLARQKAGKTNKVQTLGFCTDLFSALLWPVLRIKTISRSMPLLPYDWLCLSVP